MKNLTPLRLFVLFLPVTLLLIILILLSPVKASASPLSIPRLSPLLVTETICSPDFVGSYYLTSVYTDGDMSTNPEKALGAPDGNYGTIYQWGTWDCGEQIFDTEKIISGTIWTTVVYTNPFYWARGSTYLGMETDGSDWEKSTDWWFSPLTITKRFRYVIIEFCDNTVFGTGLIDIDSIQLDVYNGCVEEDTEGIAQTCSTVDQFHFTGDYTDTWQLSSGAIISDSILTLPELDYVRQNLTLTANKAYSAVISVTNVIEAPADLMVSLGVETETLSITGTGRYTATFNTPTTLDGPIVYKLENETVGTEINIDWTCLYLGEDQGVCIAPDNGNFDTANDWDWYRGAEWNSSSKNAVLPYNSGGDGDKSLIQSTSTYSLPALITGTYLLLGFQAGAQNGQTAVIGSRVGDSWQEFDVYASPYDYEADISSQAGQSVDVAFSNAGAASGFPAEDDLALDNVCIFVSDHPPDLPIPPDQPFSPFDFGFDYGCPDVPALLLGYGINVFTLQNTYDAGVAVWDYEHWVPWLAAALWTNAGHPISCFIVEFMRLTAGIAEQEINNFTNYINWTLETTQAAPTWLRGGFVYLVSAQGEGVAAPLRWFNWYATGFRNVIYSFGQNSTTSSSWSHAIFTATGAAPRDLQNGFLAIVSSLAAALGEAISSVMNTLLWLWNDNLLLYLYLTSSANSVIPAANPADPASPWASVLDLFLWLINFVGSIVSLVWSLFTWLVNFLFAGAVDAPVEAYHNFVAGVSSEAATADVQCVGDNFWCYFWAGVQLINQTASQTVVYPIVIIGLILATISIVYLNLYTLFHIELG